MMVMKCGIFTTIIKKRGLTKSRRLWYNIIGERERQSLREKLVKYFTCAARQWFTKRRILKVKSLRKFFLLKLVKKITY